MRLAFKLWFHHEEGGKAFGPGPAQLLSCVQQTGSLRQAASQLGMSYNKAWWNIKTMETRLGFPLLVRTVGGASGGGSKLTPEGHDLLERYQALEGDMAAALQGLCRKHFGDRLEAPRPRVCGCSEGVGRSDASEESGRPPRSRRVREFMARVEHPVISIVGKKKSGKTTVTKAVISELARRGLRVAVIKHDAHRFEIDHAGTDSFELRAAGAAVTAISSPDKYAFIADANPEPALERLVSLIPEPVDVVLTEGFKREPAPKIEVSRRARSRSLICDEDELLAVVSDQTFPDVDVPRLGMEEIGAICDLIQAHMTRG